MQPSAVTMESSKEEFDDGDTLTAGSTGAPFRLRPYQAEMVEESMKSNIIVVMDTGSGKTHMYFTPRYFSSQRTDWVTELLTAQEQNWRSANPTRYGYPQLLC